ncbi:hypothetical protein S40288_06245 [Stachybotrys chartarum IBT 40288]|nr:hypothetical protein S40288_06245 [Stachybotrys chartarum IBT 40288]
MVKNKNVVRLPHREEAQVILECYSDRYGEFIPVLHLPSLMLCINELYNSLEADRPPDWGVAALMLSICAAVMYSRMHANDSEPLFANVGEHIRQPSFWLKSMFDVVDQIRRTMKYSLETLQAMCLAYATLANTQGLTAQTRHLSLECIGMSRELGLHRIDYMHNSANLNTASRSNLKAEVGRRLWWFLAVVDWSHAQFSGPQEGAYIIHPGQMAVRKPCNISDEDMLDGTELIDRPLSEPTTMSYLLQRIRLAEICREPLDRNSFAFATPDTIEYSCILELDGKLRYFLRTVPPFFSLDEDRFEDAPGSFTLKRQHITMQRYTINVVVHRHVCKIHIPFLVQSASDPTFAPSRKACLESARTIIEVLRRIREENMKPIPQVERSVFLAAIVLVLDLCVDGSASQTPMREKEMQDAWEILRNAQPDSPSISKFLDLASQTVKKHMATHPDAEKEVAVVTPNSPFANRNLASGLPISTNMQPIVSSFAPSDMTYIEQQWQALDGGLNLETTDWDRLLWGIDAAPFI